MRVIRMIALDLDGTLLDSHKRISGANRAAIAAAKAQGIFVTLATGRMYASAVPYARELNIDLPIITCQGAYIADINGGAPLRNQTFPLEVLRDLLQMAKRLGLTSQVYADNTLSVDCINSNVAEYALLSGNTVYTVGDLGREISVEPTKMLAIGDTEALDEMERLSAEKYLGELTIAKSFHKYLEFSHIIANKGAALSFLAECLGVDKEDIMVCGDYYNDLDLFSAAGLSCAMENAVGELKSVADYITAGADNDGVARAIHRFALPDKGFAP